MHCILEKIKNESYFKWPNKMGGDLTKHYQSLHCQYHQDRGHTIEDCRTLRDYLEQLVKAGKLKKFMHQPSRQGSQAGSRYQREIVSRPPLGTINVILTTLSQTRNHKSRIMSIAVRSDTDELVPQSKRVRIEARPTLGFSDQDKIRIYQPHDDALVVNLRIGVYDVNRVLINQGSKVETMYHDLYKRLNLKFEDLLKYDSPLVRFNGKVVIPKGMIKLHVQTEAKIVEVEFIMVDAYSPYTAILARPWLHAIELFPRLYI
ncbi:uncharacterized protein LOC142632707 [Castanea sativa]|uniref:uncharacterized protein LOC142632707 n=1 Tax=Castanea sativa TaxID=21020 RepID=UPI003F64C495